MPQSAINAFINYAANRNCLSSLQLNAPLNHSKSSKSGKPVSGHVFQRHDLSYTIAVELQLLAVIVACIAVPADVSVRCVWLVLHGSCKLSIDFTKSHSVTASRMMGTNECKSNHCRVLTCHESERKYANIGATRAISWSTCIFSRD